MTSGCILADCMLAVAHPPIEANPKAIGEAINDVPGECAVRVLLECASPFCYHQRGTDNSQLGKGRRVSGAAAIQAHEVPGCRGTTDTTLRGGRFHFSWLGRHTMRDGEANVPHLGPNLTLITLRTATAQCEEIAIEDT